MRFVSFVLPAIACATSPLDEQVERAREFERKFLSNPNQFSEEWFNELLDKMVAAQQEVIMNAREVAEAKSATVDRKGAEAEGGSQLIDSDDVVDPEQGIILKPSTIRGVSPERTVVV